MQAVRAADAAALGPLMEKAEAISLAKRHPDVMATAVTLRDKLDSEAKVLCFGALEWRGVGWLCPGPLPGQTRVVCVCPRRRAVPTTCAR